MAPDAGDTATCVEREVQLFLAVGFAEYIQALFAALLAQSNQLPGGEHRNNEQDRVGAVGSRLQHLKLVHNEIFLQAGERGSGGSALQIRQ